MLIHYNLRIYFAVNRQVYPVYIEARSWVSGAYSCLSSSHIPYLKANAISGKSCISCVILLLDEFFPSKTIPKIGIVLEAKPQSYKYSFHKKLGLCLATNYS